MKRVLPMMSLAALCAAIPAAADVLAIPMAGKISSLNASNAAAILMYEVVRQRSSGGENGR